MATNGDSMKQKDVRDGEQNIEMTGPLPSEGRMSDVVMRNATKNERRSCYSQLAWNAANMDTTNSDQSTEQWQNQNSPQQSTDEIKPK